MREPINRRRSDSAASYHKPPPGRSARGGAGATSPSRRPARGGTGPQPRRLARGGTGPTPPPRRPVRGGMGPMLAVAAAAALLVVLAVGGTALSGLGGLLRPSVGTAPPAQSIPTQSIPVGVQSAPQSTVQPTMQPTAQPTPAVQEDEMYQTLYNAALAGRQTVTLHGTQQQYLDAYHRLIERPELFWIDGASYTTYTDGTIKVTLNSRYPDPAGCMRQLEKAAAEILRGVPAGANEYHKALYIHDWLVDHVTYTKRENSMDQGAYAALVERSCVCNGYTEAFQYLLEKLDVTVGSVSGVTDTGERHAWNYAVLDGEVCYFDVTWDDPVGNEHPEVIRHGWFAVTLDQMARHHYPDESEYVPVTNPQTANYHAYNGWQLDRYDADRVAAIFADQIARGSTSSLTLRCTDAQVYRQTLDALMEQDGIYDIFGAVGLPGNGFRYSADEKTFVLYLFL